MVAQRQDVETRFLMTAQDRASAVISSVRSELTKVTGASDSVRSAFIALSAAAPVAALVAKVKSSAELADTLGKLSQRTGIAVESLSALRYQADLSDVSFEDLQTGLKKFNVNLANAAGGNKDAIATFQAMGLSQKDLQEGLTDSEGLLRKVADKFAGYKDGAAKTALAVDIFGKAGDRMIVMLNEGSKGFDNARRELERFGGVVGSDFAQKAQAFNDNLTRLKVLSEASSIAVGSALVPSLNKLLEEMLKGREIAGSFGSALLLLGTINPFKSVAANIKSTRDEIERLQQDQARALQQGRSGAAAGYTPRLEAERKRLEFLQFQQRQSIATGDPSTFDARDLRRTGQQELQNAPVVQKPDGGGQDPGQAFLETLRKRLVALEENEFAALRLEAAQKKVAGAAEPLIQQLQRETEFRKQLTEAQQRDEQAAEAELSRRQGLVNGVADYVKGLEQETALMRGSNEERLIGIQLLKLEEAGLQRNTAEFEAARTAIAKAVNQNAGAKIFEDTRTPMERLGNELTRLDKLLDAGSIDWDTYARAVFKAQDEIGEFGKAVDKTKSLSEELGPVLESSFEGAAFSGGKLRDVVKGLGMDIAKLLFRRNITQPTVDAIGKLDFGGIWEDVKGFFSSANGNIMTSAGPLALQTFARGGIASKPTLALYGEGSMNEAIIPLPDGRNVPVELLGGRGSGVMVNVNVTNNAGGDTRASASSRQDAFGNLTLDVLIEKVEPMLSNRIRKGTGLAPVIEQQYGLTRSAGAYR